MGDTREFSRTETLAQTCAIETFEKAAALAFFKFPRCWMITTRKHFLYKQNTNSFAVKTWLTPSQWKLLNSRVSDIWKAITERSQFEFASRQWCLIDCQINALGTTWKCQNIFADQWENWFSLNFCWNTSPPNLIHTKLMQILRMLLDRPFSKISYSKGHLETGIFCMVTSRPKYICHIRAKWTWAGF